MYMYVYIYMDEGGNVLALMGSVATSEGAPSSLDILSAWSDVLFVPPRRGGASHEQMCDLGIMGMWHSRVPQNHHDLHHLLGWKYVHILLGATPRIANVGVHGLVYSCSSMSQVEPLV